MKYVIEKIEDILTEIDIDVAECKRVNPPEFVLYNGPWWYNPLQLIGIILCLIHITFGGGEYE